MPDAMPTFDSPSMLCIHYHGLHSAPTAQTAHLAGVTSFLDPKRKPMHPPLSALSATNHYW